jgi:glycosyltransferase involved in cell wall biosynthesis
MTPAACDSDSVKTAPVPARRGTLPHVLYVIVLDPDQKFGSLEEQICVLSRHFRDEGSQFLPLFVCQPALHKTTQFAERGVPAVCLDLHRFRPARLWDLLRLIHRHRIRVVHWNFSAPLGNKYLWALSLLAPRVQHYFTDHNSRYLPLPAPPAGVARFVKRVLLSRYRKVVGVSRYVMDCLRDQGTWSNLTCRLHFINTDRFRPDDAARERVRRDLDVTGNFVLLTIAHLIRDKGIDVALRALAALPPEVVLWVVGSGCEAGSLEALAAELGLGRRVRFLGLQRNVEPYLQAADCFVCPSRWAEAAGLVNLEALACGVPAVASNIGGIPEYVEDGETGLLFPPEDHAGLAACVRRLVEHPATHQRLRQQARARAVARFSVDSCIQDYLDLYRVTP